MVLPFLEAVFFPLVEQVCFGGTQVHNLWTPVSVLFLLCALLAVVSVGNSNTTADHAAPLIRAVVALVANAHQRAWPDVGVADYTLSVTLLAQPANSNAGLFAAHNQVGVVLGHPEPKKPASCAALALC